MSTATSLLLQDATIHQVSLICKDIAQSRKFYAEVLGAQFIAEFDPPGLLFFRFGSTRLLMDKNGKPGLLYIRVARIDQMVNSLQEKGVEFEIEVQAVFKDDDGLFGKAGDTECMAFFKDPADNTLALVEQKLLQETADA
ncbi:MAG: VOC family protein [Pseudomonadales bacterium]|nr:VOC family protein [Pseudomonadales bacterium]